jgi:type IV pilus assembly protein PilY1
MNIRKHLQRIASLSAAATVAVLTAQTVNAAPMNISDVPLNLTTGVKPNLIMAIDDSGSMDFELLLPGNDGAAWWRIGASDTCTTTLNNNSFTGCIANGSADLPGTGRPNFNNDGTANGTWRKFAYLFPNGSGGNTSDRRRLADGTYDHFAVPPIPAFGWMRSPEHNRAYFDPTTTYTPWPSGGGFTFADADVNAARFDPVFTGHGTLDLTQDFAGITSVATTAVCSDDSLGSVNSNYYFRTFTGMVLPAGACIRSTNPARSWETVRAGMTCQVGVTNGCNVTTSAGTNQVYTLANNSSVAIRYFPATFYLSAANPPPASFGYTAAPASDGLAPDGSVLNRYEIKLANFSSDAAYQAALQNFANWFSYYRKRHQALRAGLGTAFRDLSGWNVAGFTINSATTTGPNVTMGDIDDGTTRDALYANFYEDWVRSGGTPNRTAVANVIRNYRRTGVGAPIQYSCQRNFGMLFTDGFSNTPASGDGIYGIGNLDGGRGVPYQDGTSGTMADAVWGAYANTLRADLPQGRVPVPAGCSDTVPDARLDCNANPHMNFYAVTLNTRGLQFDPDNPTLDPYVTTPTWPTTFPARHPSAVDDLWHSTINGRGKLLNASSSAELADKLSELLSAMEGEVGSASSAAVSTGSVTSDTRLFQARYDSEDWSGSLSARRVEADGTLLSEVYSTVPSPSSRQIITVNSDGAAVAFDWNVLDATRQAELQPSDVLGSSRVDWLRGNQSLEQPIGTFRERTEILGDIVNSAPVFVGAPNFRYPDTLESAPYSAFRATHLNRTHMVYVGANDGMLHGFYSDDTSASGVVQERFAFIPGRLFGNLHLLTDPGYDHQYYVDGSPVVGDAFVGGAWRTMLVGGLNKGGQSIYALDVTEPSGLRESNAASVFRWEFTDADDADLGYTYSRPSIVRLNNGVWAAVFGSGYNNTVADGAASTTGDAVLYIVNLQTGALIRKISTEVGTAEDPTGGARPNGLSTPVLADTDGDYDVDVAYAGDLFGNLWKFDLSSANPASFAVAYSGVPLFRARDDVNNPQPITARPNVANGPGGQGLIVVFGTGKYLETSDTSTSPVRTQSFYGLFDPNTGDATDLIANRTDLVEQSIWVERLGETFTGDDGAEHTSDIRVVTDNPVGSGHRGWLLDLWSPLSGYEAEKAVTDPLIRDNRYVTFTTTVPNDDPCESGGSSWLMELDLFNGGRTEKTPWDMNRDGKFDEKDLTTVAGAQYPINGIRNPTIGIIPRPAVLGSEKCEFLIFPGTSGGTDSRCRNPGPRGFGRQSWRQAQ